jgi:hypothetical protein
MWDETRAGGLIRCTFREAADVVLDDVTVDRWVVSV